MELTKDQSDAMQEKISKMSPEEQREFQKQQCVFCHIIIGKVQSKKIYEDDKCIAVLDINPANPGHMLVLPKEHYSIMPQIPEEEIGYLFKVAKALSQASLKALQSHGTTIFVANGVAAGQKAQHFMIHVIPRVENDGVGLEIPHNRISEDDLNKVRKILAEKLGAVEAEIVEEPKKEEKPKETKTEKRKEPKKEKPTKKSDENSDLDLITNLLSGGK
ncbi:MAG: HIT family protein [Candidatus Woesearchaeota archaeon]|nr:HIT family protein [Candidatus Woesearchaeota archaeon]